MTPDQRRKLEAAGIIVTSDGPSPLFGISVAVVDFNDQTYIVNLDALRPSLFRQDDLSDDPGFGIAWKVRFP